MWLNILLIAGVCAGILAEAFFAVSEISLVTSDKLTFLDGDEEEEPGIRKILHLLSEPQVISHTLLIGTVLSAGFSIVLSSLLVLRLLPDLTLLGFTGILLIVLVPTLTLLGEIVPRLFYHARAEETAVRIAMPLSLSTTALKPLVSLSSQFYQAVKSVAGVREREESPFVDEGELEWIRRFTQGNETLRKEEDRIIKKIFDFSDIRVREILVPMDHVVSVSGQATVAQAMAKITESGYTRLPVSRKDDRHIVGLIHVLDLLRAPSLGHKVGACARDPFFVYPDTLVRDLFKVMQQRGVMMAAVQDREGVAQGIVTTEDILEEIFGEIEDEYDLRDQLFREIGNREYLVNARIGVQDLNEQLELKIPTDGYKTLSGYILHHLRRIPQEGERFTIGNLMFKIELADEKQIYKLFLRQLGASEKEAAAADVRGRDERLRKKARYGKDSLKIKGAGQDRVPFIRAS